MKFDTDYYESLLNGIEKRVRTRSNDMDTRDAIFRTLVDDGIVGSLVDENVTYAIQVHAHSDYDEPTARSFAMFLLENGIVEEPDLAMEAGAAFCAVFFDVQRRLATDSTAS